MRREGCGDDEVEKEEDGVVKEVVEDEVGVMLFKLPRAPLPEPSPVWKCPRLSPPHQTINAIAVHLVCRQPEPPSRDAPVSRKSMSAATAHVP